MPVLGGYHEPCFWNSHCFSQSEWSPWHLDMHTCVRNAFAFCGNAALGCRDLTNELEQFFGSGKPQYSRGDHHLWGKDKEFNQLPNMKKKIVVDCVLLAA